MLDEHHCCSTFFLHIDREKFLTEWSNTQLVLGATNRSWCEQQRFVHAQLKDENSRSLFTSNFHSQHADKSLDALSLRLTQRIFHILLTASFSRWVESAATHNPSQRAWKSKPNWIWKCAWEIYGGEMGMNKKWFRVYFEYKWKKLWGVKFALALKILIGESLKSTSSPALLPPSHFAEIL